MLEKLRKEMQKNANSEKAEILQGFFKTGVGQYGEGDVFLGIVVPMQRKIAKQFWKAVSLEDIQELLNSEIHEERLIGILILIEKYKIADDAEKKKIFDFYLNAAGNGRINNWDLVDLSAPNIVGDFLADKEDRKVLYDLARGENLWEKRIAIIACFAFIRKQDFKDALKISEILLDDKHDLIHKAVGWMLREIGKREQEVEERFLQESERYKKMPRTMLRYAIERFEEGKRKGYLGGVV
ncbi:DNA alkylation repair protein [Candidatus Pacearchaeota archaeon]|nr:DNA alkylation repair protein [Candidatus Pacearchaeota archaeon]